MHDPLAEGDGVADADRDGVADEDGVTEAEEVAGANIGEVGMATTSTILVDGDPVVALELLLEPEPKNGAWLLHLYPLPCK